MSTDSTGGETVSPPVRSAYAHDVLRRVAQPVRDTLSEEQLDAVARAIDETRNTPAPHLVDIRFTVPLLFDRFYVVLFVGVDRRRRQTRAELERRAAANARSRQVALKIRSWRHAFGLLLLWTLLGLLGLAALAVVLYVSKWALGIDLDPSTSGAAGHLKKWLGR